MGNIKWKNRKKTMNMCLNCGDVKELNRATLTFCKVCSVKTVIYQRIRELEKRIKILERREDAKLKEVLE